MQGQQFYYCGKSIPVRKPGRSGPIRKYCSRTCGKKKRAWHRTEAYRSYRKSERYKESRHRSYRSSNEKSTKSFYRRGRRAKKKILFLSQKTLAFGFFLLAPHKATQQTAVASGPRQTIAHC